jgi:hypothetical protein
MTVPASGPIKFSQIESEIGLTGSHDINQSDIRALGNVLTDRSTISFSNFRGRSKANIVIPSSTIYSAGSSYGSASLVIERTGSAGSYGIRVTINCAGEVAVWDFPSDFGASSFADNQVGGLSGANAAYVALQSYASHAAWGYGFVEYDGTNVTVLCDLSGYSYNAPPNPTYGTFIANNGLNLGCPPGSGAYNSQVNQGRTGLGSILNPTQVNGSYIIMHGYPGIVSKQFTARRNP